MDQNEKRALAHDMALRLISINHHFASTPHHVAMSAWDYADAMEKEELKRTDTTRPDVLADPSVDPVDWENDAPEWARYLFYDSKLYAVIWSEYVPLIRGMHDCKYTAQSKGRTERASNKYDWVARKSVFFRGQISA